MGGDSRRILVLTSCTGEKSVTHERPLTLKDFREGAKHVRAREKELGALLTPAEDLYSGQQHVRLMHGVRALRETSAPDDRAPKLDLWILSAGYGLVLGSRKIAPYEATFQGMGAKELRHWSEQLGIRAAVRNLLTEQYDLALLLLGDGYLKACALEEDLRLGGPTLIFCGANAAKRLPHLASGRAVVLGNPHTKQFRCGLVGLKGEVAARLLERLAHQPELIERLRDPAVDVVSVASDTSTPEEKAGKQCRPNPRVDYVIQIPGAWWDRPHRQKLQYFIPEWDDLVDPEFDFETDAHSGGQGDWSNEVYAHQLYPEPNYDGILVSKVVAEKSKKKKARINALGVHRYLRVPREFPIMGDCGAFGYIHKDVPPYTTDEILDYYTRLDFDYGVSIDHLIVTSTEAQKKQRYELTIHNAEEFLKEHRKRGLPWTPIGAVQGWDAKSYADAARKCVAMGYRYIGLGGLVRSSTEEILRVLATVQNLIRPTVHVHLFGLARIRSMDEFARLGVRSVDSASLLRRAWMGTGQNYLAQNGVFYTAIRIPEAGKSFRAKRMVSEGRASDQNVVGLQQDSLKAMSDFDAGQLSVDATLDALEAYDRLITPDRPNTRELLRTTLEARPWRTCPCGICKTDGIQVIIFRGNNRNRRRGFHNTYVFYRLLQRALSGERIEFGRAEAPAQSQLTLFEQPAEILDAL